MTLDLDALKSDFENAPPKGSDGRICGLQALVKKHPEAEAVIRDAIASDKHSNNRIAEILTKNGLKISSGCIRKHRLGACSICQGGK